MFNTNVPDSIESANLELNGLQNWFERLASMQSQAADLQARAAFVQGWLAAKNEATETPVETPPEAKDPNPDKADEKEIDQSS